MAQNTQLLSFFFESTKKHLNRCLAPGMGCTAAAIRAHSVQNAHSLDLLASDGHVKAITMRATRDTGPVLSFEDVGRNEATTFTGLCPDLDAAIFRPIDTAQFRTTDPEHLFLIAYRAVVRELHALMDGAWRIQSGYEKRIQLGLDTGNEPEPAGMLALDLMLRSYLTYVYKCSFDQALLSREYGAVLHHPIMVSHDQPTVGVCSLFSLDGLCRGDDCVRVALNVLPLSRTESLAVFSFLPPDAELVRAGLDRILSSDGVYQKYLLSKLILNNCENFVVSPPYFDRWSAEKRAAITDFCVDTITAGNLELEDRNLYLF